MDTPPTIVTVAEDVDAERRALKQAVSVGLLGYRSIVVERRPSPLELDELPLERVSLEAWRLLPEGSPRVVRAARRTAAVFALGVLKAAIPPAADDALHQNEAANRSVARFRRYLTRYLKLQVIKTLRRLPRAPVYYLHGFHQFPAVWALCRVYGSRLVYDAPAFFGGSAVPEPSDDPLLDGWIREVSLRLEARCIKNAFEIVAPSPSVAEQIEAQLGRKPIVIRNVEDVRLSCAPLATLREAIGSPMMAFVVAIVGDADEVAVEALLEAALLCPSEVHFAFVGSGYERFRSRVDGGEMADRVHFIPPVDRFELTPFLETADAVVVAPRQLNGNLDVFFSAVSAGLPVLYPKRADLTAVDPSGELGLVVNLASPASVRDAIVVLIDDRALYLRLHDQVKARAEELEWAVEERKLQEILEAAMRAGRRR